MKGGKRRTSGRARHHSGNQNGGLAEFINGRAFARPVGLVSPPYRTMIDAKPTGADRISLAPKSRRSPCRCSTAAPPRISRRSATKPARSPPGKALSALSPALQATAGKAGTGSGACLRPPRPCAVSGFKKVSRSETAGVGRLRARAAAGFDDLFAALARPAGRIAVVAGEV